MRVIAAIVCFLLSLPFMALGASNLFIDGPWTASVIAQHAAVSLAFAVVAGALVALSVKLICDALER